MLAGLKNSLLAAARRVCSMKHRAMQRGKFLDFT
jgi:hypothetical protein